MFMCIGVSGDARRQECITPPTTDDPHFVEHPTKDKRYGKHIFVQLEHTVNSLHVLPHRLKQYKLHVNLMSIY